MVPLSKYNISKIKVILWYFKQEYVYRPIALRTAASGIFELCLSKILENHLRTQHHEIKHELICVFLSLRHGVMLSILFMFTCTLYHESLCNILRNINPVNVIQQKLLRLP